MLQPSRPKVYVIKEQAIKGHLGTVPMDYTPAYKYGDVVFITDFDLPLHNRGLLGEAWHKAVCAFVEQYDDARDFIITTGQPLAIFMVGHCLGMYGKRPRMLVWRPQEGRYQAVEFASGMLEVAA